MGSSHNRALYKCPITTYYYYVQILAEPCLPTGCQWYRPTSDSQTLVCTTSLDAWCISLFTPQRSRFACTRCPYTRRGMARLSWRGWLFIYRDRCSPGVQC